MKTMMNEKIKDYALLVLDAILSVLSIISLILSIIANNKSQEAVTISSMNKEKVQQATQQYANDIGEINNKLRLYNITDEPVSPKQFDQDLQAIFKERMPVKGALPKGLDHVKKFYEIQSSNGNKANDLTEAWVMAYIEKNQNAFSYKGSKIYQYKESEKLDTIINLVKEKGADNLLNEIAPLIKKK